jgi:beta-lactam-binding protein with PASTA domain
MNGINPTRGGFVRRHLLLGAKIALFGASLVVVAALSAYMTVRSSVSGRDVVVPDLTDMTVEEATGVLTERGLILEEAAQRNDARIVENHILTQDPPPGANIKLQRKIKVVVSLGDKVTSIPDLRGGAARKAQITLQQQGLRVAEQIYAYSRREHENLVIAQDPPPGVAGMRDGKVALLISRGRRPRTYVMPHLIGQPEKRAMRILTRAGLRPAPVRRDPGLGGVPGSVVAQRPEAGYRVRSGDLVILTVAQEAGGVEE